MENENINENINEVIVEDANEKKTNRKKFVKPDENDVYNLMGELNVKGGNFLTEDKLVNFARTFMDHYEANGWIVGKASMKDWQSTVRNWMRREWDKINNQKSNQYGTKQKFDNVAHYQNVAAKIAADFAREREMREDSSTETH